MINPNGIPISVSWLLIIELLCLHASVMDPISAAQTAWSIFNSCYQVYKVVNSALELDTDSALWDVQIRVERVRFVRSPPASHLSSRIHITFRGCLWSW